MVDVFLNDLNDDEEKTVRVSCHLLHLHALVPEFITGVSNICDTSSPLASLHDGRRPNIIKLINEMLTRNEWAQWSTRDIIIME